MISDHELSQPHCCYYCCHHHQLPPRHLLHLRRPLPICFLASCYDEEILIPDLLFRFQEPVIFTIILLFPIITLMPFHIEPINSWHMTINPLQVVFSNHQQFVCVYVGLITI